MTNELLQILKDSPLLTLFLVAGAGYLLGELNLFGFRLGVAGVLFAGLTAGAIWPQLTVPDILGNFGLVLFVYAMGLQSGRGFFPNFRLRGARYSLFALAVLMAGFTSLILVARLIHLSGERAAGLFTGAVTNTPALAVVLQMAGSNLPAETYSIAYPFGVIGILACFHLAQRVWKPAIEPSSDKGEILVRNFAVKNPGIAGRTVGDIHRLYPAAGFQISRVQHGGKVEVAGDETRLEHGDVVVVVGDDESFDRALAIFGEAAELHIEVDRTHIDYRRIFVSNRDVDGKRIEELHLSRFPCSITRIRRGDSDFIPAPQTILHFGDRIRVVAEREKLKAISQFFGDSIRGTAELDFASVGIGLVLGVLVGMIPIPIPGFGTFRLGFAGGPLVVALVLGSLEHTGPFSWSIPTSANLTLRQVGLLLFLASVGIHSGPGFVSTFQKNGPVLLLGGAVVTLSVTLTALVVGYRILRIPFDELLGVVAGIHTESAAVAFASHMTRTDRAEVGYASVYPVAMILKVILAQVIFGLGPF